MLAADRLTSMNTKHYYKYPHRDASCLHRRSSDLPIQTVGGRSDSSRRQHYRATLPTDHPTLRQASLLLLRSIPLHRGLHRHIQRLPLLTRRIGTTRSPLLPSRSPPTNIPTNHHPLPNTQTTIVTTTATAPPLLPTPCDAAHNYGLVSNGFGYSYSSPDEVAHAYGFGEAVRGACCARCYATANCFAFSEDDLLVDGVDGTFGGVNCAFVLIAAAHVTSAQNPTCPLGSLTVLLNPPATTASATYYDGVGPCGIPTVVPGNVERRA